MSALLERAPYRAREDETFLGELNALTRHHVLGCEPYARICAGRDQAFDVADVPYLHVGVFKHVHFRTQAPGVSHERALKSSATTGSVSSIIALDRESSVLQGRSSVAILKDFVGGQMRPLLVLDSARSLRARGELSARVAAAMSLRPMAEEIRFLLDDPDDPTTMRWDDLRDVLKRYDDILVYGFTWILWLAWAKAQLPDDVADAMQGKRIHFVHSGGWKRLEALRVDRATFDGVLLEGSAPGSAVVDFYGLVEQVGIIYPLCIGGCRHVPVWADALVRDPWTGVVLEGEAGQLQLLNTLAGGAPYHSVLTEDLGRMLPGHCVCGRSGKRFELLGRVPKAEVRGCANA